MLLHLNGIIGTSGSLALNVVLSLVFHICDICCMQQKISLGS